MLFPRERSLTSIFLETTRRTQGCVLELPLPIRRTGAHHFYLVEFELTNLGQMMAGISLKMQLSLVLIRDP
jgi:hypothetical protein